MFEEFEYHVRTILDNICEVFDRRKLGRFLYYKDPDKETIVVGRIVQVSSCRFVIGHVLYTVLTEDGKIDYIPDNEVYSITKDNPALDEYDDYVEELVQALVNKNEVIAELISR